jgi:hypothetical protein
VSPQSQLSRGSREQGSVGAFEVCHPTRLRQTVDCLTRLAGADQSLLVFLIRGNVKDPQGSPTSNHLLPNDGEMTVGQMLHDVGGADSQRSGRFTDKKHFFERRPVVSCDGVTIGKEDTSRQALKPRTPSSSVALCVSVKPDTSNSSVGA